MQCLGTHVCREGRIQIFCWWEIEMLFLLFWTRKPEMPNMVLVIGHHFLTPNPGNVCDGQWRPNTNVGWASLPLCLLSAQRCVHGRLFLKTAGNSISLLRDELPTLRGLGHSRLWAQTVLGCGGEGVALTSSLYEMPCSPQYLGVTTLVSVPWVGINFWNYPFTDSFLFSL